MISTHVLDTSRGEPAADINVQLEIHDGSSWKTLSKSQSSPDGRVVFNAAALAGTYRLSFETDAYFARLKQESFFPNPSIVFNVININRNYHVPLLLNPFGYSTYRGS